MTVNAPPTATAGGPYIGAEGAQLVLHGTANDVDGDTLSYNWGFTWTGDPGTQCVATGTTTLDPSITCNNDANVTATLTVNDGVNAPVVTTASLLVVNVASTIDTLQGSAPIVPAGGTFSITASFSDPGSIDTHTAVTDWGDGSTSNGS